MKCGKCKETGPDITVQHVKDCYNAVRCYNHDNPNCSECAVERSSLGTPEAKALRSTVSDEHAARVVERSRQLSFDNSDIQGRPSEEQAPAGRYAVEEDGVLKFLLLDYGKPGTRWEGYQFLSIQASDDKYPIKDPGRRARLVATIEMDIQGAMVRYGKELGKCGHCGRTLTDEDSRAAGIGPVCANKMGWNR